MVDAFKGSKLDNSEFEVIISDHKRLLESNGTFELRFIIRGRANQVVDVIARVACDYDSSMIHFECHRFHYLIS